MKEQIKIARDTLSSLLEGIGQYDDLESQLAALQAEVDASKAELEQIHSDLAEGRAGISAAAEDNLRRHNEELLRKQTHLTELTSQVSALEEQRDELTIACRDIKARHDNIAEGIAGLREKLR